jgi:hypothetical protein
MPDNRALPGLDIAAQTIPRIAHQVSDLNDWRSIIAGTNTIAVPTQGRDTHTKKCGNFDLGKKLSLFYQQGFLS